VQREQARSPVPLGQLRRFRISKAAWSSVLSGLARLKPCKKAAFARFQERGLARFLLADTHSGCDNSRQVPIPVVLLALPLRHQSGKICAENHPRLTAKHRAVRPRVSAASRTAWQTSPSRARQNDDKQLHPWDPQLPMQNKIPPAHVWKVQQTALQLVRGITVEPWRTSRYRNKSDCRISAPFRCGRWRPRSDLNRQHPA
jgi:hypothetical protein